jgi:CheY-like chemotaxis protein
MLAGLNLTPTAVHDGPAALEALTAAAAAHAPFGLLLLDACMPGMDGFAVAERVSRTLSPAPSMIMMLASDDPFEDAERCHLLGIRAHFPKPVKRSDLVEALAHVLRPPTVKAPRRPALELTSQPMRILLAEDNAINQRVAVGLLTRRGHTVDVANNGIEALDALDKAQYDVLLMDIQMPEMGGVEATHLIRQREVETGGHLRIIAMTAHAMKGDREQYLSLGMDGYISKPVDQAALFSVVEATSTDASDDVVHAGSPAA